MKASTGLVFFSDSPTITKENVLQSNKSTSIIHSCRSVDCNDKTDRNILPLKRYTSQTSEKLKRYAQRH